MKLPNKETLTEQNECLNDSKPYFEVTWLIFSFFIVLIYKYKLKFRTVKMFRITIEQKLNWYIKTKRVKKEIQKNKFQRNFFLFFSDYI